MKVDSTIDAWERRNAGALDEEREARRRSRIIAFRRVDIMLAVMREAALRTATALDLREADVTAALSPDPETKRLKPAVAFAEGVEVDEARAAKVFTFAFEQVSKEWSWDLATALADVNLGRRLAEALPKESLDAFCARLKG